MTLLRTKAALPALLIPLLLLLCPAQGHATTGAGDRRRLLTQGGAFDRGSGSHGPRPRGIPARSMGSSLLRSHAISGHGTDYGGGPVGSAMRRLLAPQVIAKAREKGAPLKLPKHSIVQEHCSRAPRLDEAQQRTHGRKPLHVYQGGWATVPSPAVRRWRGATRRRAATRTSSACGSSSLTAGMKCR